jgi:hypothetical protein
VRIGVEEKDCLRRLKAEHSLSPKMKGIFLQVRRVSGITISEKL